jgi:oligopeptide transport system substrate-binding protein
MKFLLPLLAFALAACGSSAEREPITMSVIGTTLAMQDPDSGRSDAANALMLSATAQGLLVFDANGQVDSGLAERWIVTDDGMSIIFRLREAQWATGGKVSSEDVARSLRLHMASNRRNPLQPHFANVEAVVAMTDRIVEFRLKLPDPTLLQILAQPEMAIFKRAGTGPYRVHSQRDGVIRLRPIPPPLMEGESAPTAAAQSLDVRIRAERAALAISRFKNGTSALVSGGSFSDLTYAQAADLDQGVLKIEYPMGLFGLRATNAPGSIADRGVRVALSAAIDREALVRAFGANGWQPAISVLPSSLGSASPPAALVQVQKQLAERRASAKAAIQSLAGNTKAIPIRLALPETAGARILFARIKADWSHIQVEAVRVAPGQAADLILIDRVAAFSHALWYLEALGCAPGLLCSEKFQSNLAALRSIPDQAERATAIGAVDAELASSQMFIPLAIPLRWSLVDAELSQWKANRFAAHPIRRLRE